MTRRVTSSDVIDFSTHIPEDEVNVYKEANMNFNKVLVAGSKEPIITLTSAQGTSNCSLMPEVRPHNCTSKSNHSRVTNFWSYNVFIAQLTLSCFIK